MRKAGTAQATSLADAVELDARKFPLAVKRDEAALAAAARRLGFDLFVFTNAGAHAGHYRLLRHAAADFESRPLPALAAGPSPILAVSPLARPEILRAALSEVAGAYRGTPPDVVLIVNSHGDTGLAVMPRVSTDVTAPAAAAAFARALAGGAPPATPPPWAALKGIAKPDFWRVLGEASAAHGLRYPLVFLESCQSGPAAWRDRAVPDSVARVAHSGADDLNMDDFDFAPIFAPLRAGDAWIAALARGLEERRMRVDGPTMLAVRAAWQTVAALHPGWLFAPLGAWLIWFAVRWSRSKGRAVSRAA